MAPLTRPTWFAVSTLTALRRRGTPRRLVLEDVFLVRARTAAEAARRGAALGRAEARGGGAITWNGEAVRVAFAGVRKVVACAATPARHGGCKVARLTDGVEATRSQFVVRSARELRLLASGRPVEVLYEA